MASIAEDMRESVTLPADAPAAALAGRVWLPQAQGPAVVAVRGERLYDISRLAPTMRDLVEANAPADIVQHGEGTPIGPLAAILANTPEAQRDSALPWLL